MAASAELSDLRIAVLGTGANGSIIGAELARAGLNITFIDQWPANVEAIRERGIRVELEGSETSTTVEALHLCEVAEVREPFDAVLLVTKAYDTRWATELIKPLLHEDSFVIGVQNGMTADDIAEIVGDDRALGAVVEVTSAMYEPGLAERHSAYDKCWFAVGAVDESAQRHVPVAAALLRHAGIVEETDDIRSAKWMKLVLNVAELVTSAVLDLPIAECAKYPGMREVMLGAGDEAIAAARAHGYEVRPIFGMAGDEASDPSTYVATILDELVGGYILPHSRSTVLQDWMKQRRSEVDELHGEVVRLAGQHGLSAPINQAVSEFAHAIEHGRIAAGVHNVAPLKERIRELSEERVEMYVRADGRLEARP